MSNDQDEVWHAAPEQGTGQLRLVDAPASKLLIELDRMVSAERSKMRGFRAADNAVGIAASRGRIDGLATAVRIVMAARYDFRRLQRVPRELWLHAEEQKNRARVSFGKRRIEHRARAAALQQASGVCEAAVEALHYQRVTSERARSRRAASARVFSDIFSHAQTRHGTAHRARG